MTRVFVTVSLFFFCLSAYAQTDPLSDWSGIDFCDEISDRHYAMRPVIAERMRQEARFQRDLNAAELPTFYRALGVELGQVLGARGLLHHFEARRYPRGHDRYPVCLERAARENAKRLREVLMSFKRAEAAVGEFFHDPAVKVNWLGRVANRFSNAISGGEGRWGELALGVNAGFGTALISPSADARAWITQLEHNIAGCEGAL